MILMSALLIVIGSSSSRKIKNDSRVLLDLCDTEKTNMCQYTQLDVFIYINIYAYIYT